MFFQIKFKSSKKFRTVYDFTQDFSFFCLHCYAFPVKVFIQFCISYSCDVHLTKKLEVYLNAYRLAIFLMLQNFHISMF